MSVFAHNLIREHCIASKRGSVATFTEVLDDEGVRVSWWLMFMLPSYRWGAFPSDFDPLAQNEAWQQRCLCVGGGLGGMSGAVPQPWRWRLSWIEQARPA